VSKLNVEVKRLSVEFCTVQRRSW